MAAQASPCGPDPPRIPAEPLDLLRRLNATPNVHPEPRPASPRSPVPPPARISPSAVSSHPTPSRRSPSQPDPPTSVATFCTRPSRRPLTTGSPAERSGPPPAAVGSVVVALDLDARLLRPRPRWGPPRAPLLADQGVRRTSPAIAVGAATVRGGRRCAQPTASMRASGCGQRAVDNLGRGDPPLRTVFHRLVDPCGNWGSTTVSFVHTCGHRCGELWITLSTALSTTGDNRAVSALETSRARPRYPLRWGRP